MKSFKKVLLFSAVVLSLLLSGCAKDGYVASKVFVKNVDIGGMSREEAISAIEKLEMDENASVVIDADGKSIEISAEEMGARYDAEKTVEAAIEDGKGLFSGWGKKEYEPLIKLDEKMLDDAITKRLADMETHVTQTRGEATNEGIKVTVGTSGMQIDRKEAAEKIKSALKDGSKEKIKLSIVKVAPDSVDYDEFFDLFASEYKEGGYILNEDGTITVTEAVPGCTFDREAARSIMKAHTNEGETFVIPCSVKLPPYTKAEMEEGLFRDTLSTFTTDFSTSSANRCENIRLASNSINNTLMMPGDVFSFNDALGERTAARGYKPAGAYAAGETVTAVGGGICQVSSTLYNSALLANLEIVSRRSHQMTVSYVKVGRDATVNWGTTDFKFKNSTGHPIKILSTVNGKKITISIVGMQTIPNMKVEIITNTVSVIPPEEKIVEDSEKEVGYTSTKKGSNGYVVDAVRVVYSGDTEVKRENLTRSRYNPTKTVVTVGTKPADTPFVTENTTSAVEEAQKSENEDTMPPGLLPPDLSENGI